MKVGQTSLIMFLSKLLSSALGFIATLYFARELGAEIIGIYALVITVVSWLILAGELGVGEATTKRISEAKEQGAYLAAALVWVASFAIVLSVAVIIARPLFEGYLADFSRYVTLSVVWFVIAILIVDLFYQTVFRTLKGERKVHIVGLLNPVEIGSQSLVQIALVFAGYGLLGMLVGYTIGGIIVGLVGLYWVTIRPTPPRKRHFKSLFDYAKFSWLGSLRSRTFNEVDILLLGVFVQPSLVGVYSIAWSLAKFISLFGGAISQTMFPEISHTSSQETNEAAAGLIEDSLAFSGLIAIPGLVGSAILAQRLLRIYGPAFVEGTTVLVLLVFAILLNTYQNQLLNAMNGIDRADLSFRINAVFIALNTSLNVVLIWQFGIEGAAIASVVSVTAVLALAHRSLGRLIEFRTPLGEVTRQAVAALVMGAVVFGALETIETTGVLQHNAAIVLLLVSVGAGLYFTVLLVISPRFRSTVDRNLPVDVAYLN